MGALWDDHKWKNLSFWSVVCSYSIQQWIISQSDCDVQQVDFTWQHRVTSSAIGPRRSSKALHKAKFAPKKVGEGIIVTVWWSVAGLIHYKFLNSSESIASEKSAQQIDEMYQK